MKSLHLTLFILLLTCQLSAQILNDYVNVEIQTKRLYSNVSVFNDPIPFDLEDVVLKVNVWNDLFGWGTTAACYEFNSDGPVYLNNHNQPIFSFYGIPYATNFDFNLFGWESDSSPACTYNGDDSNYEEKTASGYYLINNQLTNLRPPIAWSTDWSNQNGDWLFYDSDYDMVVQSVWRYVNGENISSALDFGTIAVGQSKVNANSNKSAPAGVSSASQMGYQNDAYEDSPDVYYQFTISEDANVILTVTGFDTYMHLLNSNNEVIAYDDQSGPGDGSLIEKKLCPGTYYVVVEGYQNNTGNFTLAVSVANALANVSPGILNYLYAECPDGTGSVFADPTGGVPPYIFEWPNGQPATSSPQASNIPIGTSSGVITDACGVSNVFDIVMLDDDNVAPNAVCINKTYYLVPNEAIVVNPAEVGGGSTDNCQIEFLELSQSNFTYNDVGINQVTLTAIDYAGNSSSCNATVEIIQDNTNAINDLEQSIPFTLVPNPASDWFEIVIDPLELNSNTQISIVTLTGQLVWKSIVFDSNQRIDISDFTKGVYLVRLNDSEKAGVRKLMVN